jgi:hypothetical protein
MATIEEVRQKASQIDEALTSAKDTAKQGAARAVVALFVLVVVVFLLGRRRGKSKNTVVEVYRD